MGPGWTALRAGDVDRAETIFRSGLGQETSRIEASIGLGYVALRRDQLEEAAARFDAALKLQPEARDALVGRALAAERSGDPGTARDLLLRSLAQVPEDPEAIQTLRRVRGQLAAAAARPPDDERHLPPMRSPDLRVDARVNGQLIEQRAGDGRWRPVFIKAVNLGAALPGRYPSEFPTERGLYLEWFAAMRSCGFNAVRLYTIFPPVFYEALLEFNAPRQDPLYVIHGVWTELPPEDHFDDPAFLGAFRDEIRRVVDLMHGALDLPLRPGHASGRYRADVSRWWLATILGREWEPYSVVAYNQANPGRSSLDGVFVQGHELTAMERWLAEQMEFAISYETLRWNAQRPVAFTNWPTLDPLSHPTESTKAEEEAWRQRLGLPSEPGGVREYDNDAVGLDMEKIHATGGNRGGLFAVYHAYPYYPDFMVFDPGYVATVGPEGPNAYLGYLRDLLAHHRSHPVFIAEFGVPSSREVAHVQPQGWTHGGHDDAGQGEIDARLMRTIHHAGAAGGALFAWIDEWFKHNWLVIEYHRPMERNRLWHDRQDAEQNYGLLAYRPGDPGPPVVLDGDPAEWTPADVLLRSSDPEAPVRSLSVRSDASHLYLLLEVQPGSELGQVVAVDVVDPVLGDHRFPAGLDLASEAGFEAAVLIAGGRAQVVLDDTYERFANRVRRLKRPLENRRGDYLPPRIQPNRRRIGRDGTVFPATVLEIGELRLGTTDRSLATADSRADWSLDAQRGVIELRLPWGLLNVTDPSSRCVLFEGPDHPDGCRTVDGIRLAVAAFAPAREPLEPAPSAPGRPRVAAPITAADPRPIQVLPEPGADGVVPVPPLYRWPTWEEPQYHTFRKRAYDIFCSTLHALPDVPAPRLEEDAP